MEWEILGDLGVRLHHKEEAKEAYQRCLDSPRYTVKPWAKLMEMYADEGDIQRCVQTAIRVAAYQYAEYTEMAVCVYNDILRVEWFTDIYYFSPFPPPLSSFPR